MSQSCSNADLASGAVHLDRTAACCVGHAIEIAVDRDLAVAGDAPLHPQHRLELAGRQSLEAWVLFGEMLGDDTPRGGMDAHIGHRIEPVVELCIEVRGSDDLRQWQVYAANGRGFALGFAPPLFAIEDKPDRKPHENECVAPVCYGDDAGQRTAALACD